MKINDAFNKSYARRQTKGYINWDKLDREVKENIEQALLDIVGEDEDSLGFPSYDPERTPKFKYDRRVESNRDEARNQLRAELRKAIKDFCNE